VGSGSAFLHMNVQCRYGVCFGGGAGFSYWSVVVDVEDKVDTVDCLTSYGLITCGAKS